MTDSEKPAPSKPHKAKKGEVEELRRQIEALQKEKDEILGKLQRVSADYTNFQKRVPRQISDTLNYEKDKIFRTLLPVLDNFEHLFRNADSSDVNAIIKGVRITYEHMLEVMKSHNVEQIKAAGEVFQPGLHDAIMHQAKSELPDNTVIEELQKGYTLEGRIIRPSKVLVNKLPPPQDSPAQQDGVAESPAQMSQQPQIPAEECGEFQGQ